MYYVSDIILKVLDTSVKKEKKTGYEPLHSGEDRQ